MKILYVHGDVNNAAGNNIVQALRKIGYDAEEYPTLQSVPTSQLEDGRVKELEAYIQENNIDFLISIYFIMNAALASYEMKIRYISILWDAPYTSIYNVLGRLDNVWVSTFDKMDYEKFLKNGIQHVIYQPLSVNETELMKWNREIQDTLQGQYIHDISFIGSLYDTNAYDDFAVGFPPNIQRYFNSIFEEAAFKWDGINRIYGKTDKEMIAYLQLINPDFTISNRQDIDDTIYFDGLCLSRKVANIERIAVLNLLAESYSVALYTGSQEAAKEKLKNVVLGPMVEYGQATSLVYAGSKINLNITLRGIERGTPQRVMDIMGAGGFMLSSYSPETAELFEEDKEIVMFKNPEELMEKAGYYLSHDDERRQIAQAGYEKVISCYTYEKKLRELMEWIEEGV